MFVNLIEHVGANEEHFKMKERSNMSNTSNSTYKEGVYKWSAEEEEEDAHGPSCTRIDQGHSPAQSLTPSHRTKGRGSEDSSEKEGRVVGEMKMNYET